MNGRSAQWRLLGLVAIAGLLAGCKGKDKLKPEEQAATAKDQYAIDSARMELDRAAAEEPTPSKLAGSAWLLVHLQARDSVITPEGMTIYRLEFGDDGQAIVVGGCNRGGGSYSATPKGELTFGPLATTRAMCPPESMSARYLGDFAEMRSYRIVGGHLFISLADGSVYDFAPEAPLPQITGGKDSPVLLLCADSTGAKRRMQAVFSAGKADTVTLRYQGKQMVLPQVRSGSGARYEGPAGLFWTKGRAATVTWEKVNLYCTVLQE